MSNAEDNTTLHEFSNSGYDMSDEEVQVLTRQLMERKPALTDAKYVCYEIEGADDAARIGRYVEKTRFEVAFGNSAEDMQKEYGPYETASTFFISVDQENAMPSGALRIIRQSPSGLKTINDVSELPLRLSAEYIQQAHRIETFDDCWDIGTVAAMPGYPSGAASIQLYRTMYLAAMRERIQHVVSVVDARVLQTLTQYLGIPFMPLADSGPFEYLGSKSSQAVYGYVPEFYEKMEHKRQHSLRGLLARKALNRLVAGTEDHTLMLNDYKK